MCDPTDPFTGALALCVGGVTVDGWACTGHAHVDGQHVRCTDSSHDAKAPEFGVTVPAGGLSIPPGGLFLSAEFVHPFPAAGTIPATERWTCSSP